MCTYMSKAIPADVIKDNSKISLIKVPLKILLETLGLFVLGSGACQKVLYESGALALIYKFSKKKIEETELSILS